MKNRPYESTDEPRPYYPLTGHYSINAGETVSIPWEYSDDLTPFDAAGYIKIEPPGFTPWRWTSTTTVTSKSQVAACWN